MPMDLQATRRDFLSASAAAATGLALTARGDEAKPLPKGKAEHCIFLWLGGGAGQIDTWDPKRLGDPKAKQPGSYYPAVDTAIAGVQVCQHLSRCAKIYD